MTMTKRSNQCVPLRYIKPDVPDKLAAVYVDHGDTLEIDACDHQSRVLDTFEVESATWDEAVARWEQDGCPRVQWGYPV